MPSLGCQHIVFLTMNFSDWIDVMLKGFNIMLIFWIFRKNYTERRAERIRDLRHSSTTFVIQDLILKPNIEKLDEFYIALGSKVKELHFIFSEPDVKLDDVQNLTAENMQKMKALLDPIESSIFTPLFNLSKVFLPLKDCFRSFEDIYGGFIDKLVMRKPITLSDMLDEVENWRGKVTAELLNAQMEFRHHTEHPKNEGSLITFARRLRRAWDVLINGTN